MQDDFVIFNSKTDLR